jgi:transposase-like protein
MNQETLTMSYKERGRMAVLRLVQAGEITLTTAAAQLGVSLRQAVRIKKRFMDKGDEGLVHRARGMPSNRRYCDDFRQQVLDLYREKYPDFGPTLAAEKMREIDGVQVHPETLRRWLIGANLWQVGRKQRTHRARRTRRARFGQMLQLDGSDHLWFEDRGPRCTLMVLVDDATGRIALHMAASETTHAALTLLHKWVRAHGVPGSIYTDRNSAYFTQEFLHDRDRRGDPAVFTDFMKSTDRLGIVMIPAYSPQAKGRVERVNRTLQDRLVKELRLRNIDTIEEANLILDAFAQDYNRRFAVQPAHDADAHQIAPRGKEEWERCFCVETSRVVRKDWTVSFSKHWWQIPEQEDGPKPGERVCYRRLLDGTGYWVWQNRRLRVLQGGANQPGTSVPAKRGPAPAPPGFSA